MSAGATPVSYRVLEGYNVLPSGVVVDCLGWYFSLVGKPR